MITDYIKKNINGKCIVVPVGDNSDFNGVIELNNTAEIIWDGAYMGKSSEEIAKDITDKFDISFEKALNDTNNMISKLTEAGIIER